MTDGQKVLLITSYLMRYPDETWFNEFDEWKREISSVAQSQLKQYLNDFVDYIESTPRKDFEDQYVRAFDFSKNTTLYLSAHELTDTGEQAEELVKYKSFFLENGYDVPKELPDYVPALLELCAAVEITETKRILDFSHEKLDYIRNRLIEAKLPYAFLFDVILAVANGLEEQSL